MNRSIDTSAEDADFKVALGVWTAANQKRDFRSAAQAAEQVMDRAAELMIAEADVNGPPDDLLLGLQAKVCEELGDWEGAFRPTTLH